MISRWKPVSECRINTWARTAVGAAISLLCLVSVAWAQADPPLRGPRLLLGELYRSVEASSPRLEAARQLTRAAEARIAPARRPPDPQFQIGHGAITA